MHDLFISYAREDSEWVESFCGQLQAQGFTIWKDSSIPAGQSFGRVIEQAIADSRVVLVVWSKYSVESDWVRAEALEGLRRGVLIPVLIDRSQPPLRYRTIQTIKLSDWKFAQNDSTFRLLIEEIKTLIAAGPRIADHSSASRPDLTGDKRRSRFTILSVVALLIVGSGIATWLWLDNDRHRQRSVELTSFSNDTLQELQRQKKGSSLYWGYFLEQEAGQTLIERAALLALEAVASDPSPQARTSLASSLVLLNRPLKQVGSEGSATRGAISGDGLAVAWSAGDEVNLWLPAGDQGSSIQFRNEEFIGHLRFMPDPNYLLVAGTGGSVNLWSRATGEKHPIVSGNGANVLGIAIDTAGETMAIRQPGVVRIWNLASVTQLASIDTGRFVYLNAVQSLDITGDGRHLAFASGDRIRIWDLTSNQQVFEIAFDKTVAGLKFTPSGERLTGASTHGQIKIIGMRYGDEKLVFRGPKARITIFDPSGARVARAAYSRVVVTETADQQTPGLEYRHDDNVTDISFSHDGRMLASAGQDGMVRVWDISARQELNRFGLKAKVITLGFTADGSSLITIAGNGNAALWPLGYDDPVAAACSRLSRNLTVEEWRRYLPGEPFRRTCPDLQPDR